MADPFENALLHSDFPLFLFSLIIATGKGKIIGMGVKGLSFAFKQHFSYITQKNSFYGDERLAQFAPKTMAV